MDFRLSDEQRMIRDTVYVEFCDSEMAERSASDTFQIHCGYGFINEYAVSRYYRTCKILQIVEGTSEIRRLVISRNL